MVAIPAVWTLLGRPVALSILGQLVQHGKDATLSQAQQFPSPAISGLHLTGLAIPKITAMKRIANGDPEVTLLQRAGVRSFRRCALLRSDGRSAAQPRGLAALDGRQPLARHAREMASLGSVALRRSSAGA